MALDTTKPDGFEWLWGQVKPWGSKGEAARDVYRQFRFKAVVDPRTGVAVHTLEHEVRAPSHEANPLR